MVPTLHKLIILIMGCIIGKIEDNGMVKGKGTYSQPEWTCVAEEIGKAIGGGTGGRRCPIANYPAWWSAHKI